MTGFDQLVWPLRGSQVREIRERYRLSRAEFTAMCGFTSSSRVMNIERNESWKDGDQETVLAVLKQIMANPPRDKRTGRVRGESAEQRLNRLEHDLQANGKLLREEPPSVPEDTTTYQPELDFELDAIVIPEPDEPSLYIPDDDLRIGSDVVSTLDWVDVLSDIAPGTTKVLNPKRITNSEVTTWERCRRKWWLSYYRELGLTMTDVTGHRATGKRIHRALAAWYAPEGEERIDPRDVLERVIVEDWTELTRGLTEQQANEQQLAELAAKFADATSLERAMIEGYFEWLVETGADVNLEVIASETELTADVMIDLPEGEQVPAQLVGKLDVRVRRVSDGVRYLVDHKSVQNFADPRKTLHMDPQMLHYHLLEFLNTGEADQRCDGALYNMLRKVKRTANAKPPFYDRVEVRHNEHEIESYRQRVLGATRDILLAERALDAGENPLSVVYPTVGRDCSYMCDFFAVCNMFDDGSRVEDAISTLYQRVDPLARYDASINEL